MSDFILKIFPVAEVAADKTDRIRQQLVNNNFLSGEEFEFCGEMYLRPGDAFCNYFEFEDEGAARQSYRNDIRIKIAADGYGVAMEEGVGEPAFINRKNVLEVWNADGNYTGWDKLTALMQQATGDVYTGEWELL